MYMCIKKCFYPFTYNLYMSLDSKLVSYKQTIVKSYFVIYSTIFSFDLYIQIITFKAITDMLALIVTILLILCVPSCSHASFFLPFHVLLAYCIGLHLELFIVFMSVFLVVFTVGSLGITIYLYNIMVY